jgi:hypothetical protein
LPDQQAGIAAVIVAFIPWVSLIVHAAALSSLSAPRITILSVLSGTGVEALFASSHGARQTCEQRLRRI